MVSFRQQIFQHLDSFYEKNKSLDYDLQSLYTKFKFKDGDPTLLNSTNSIKTYAGQWKKSKKSDISQPDPPVDDSLSEGFIDVHEGTIITTKLVEEWILNKDSRASLGMKFIQYRDQFSKEGLESDITIDMKGLISYAKKPNSPN